MSCFRQSHKYITLSLSYHFIWSDPNFELRHLFFKKMLLPLPISQSPVSISYGQRNLMKTYHNDANSSGITKIALKKFLDFF